MNEQFLQYLWKNKLYDTGSLITSDGQQIIVESPGIQSFDAGPDFVQAKIRIDETLWAGNIEIHIRSSDWYRHNHHLDKAYDNVVLHVVYTHDKDINRSNGTSIPALELTFNENLLRRYTALQISPDKVACEKHLPTVNRFFVDNWLDSLLVERLNLKATQIKIAYEHNNSDLNETFYQLLMKNLGFKTNKQPMEQLARQLPFKYLLKHRDNLLQVEALLFGQAGFLSNIPAERYPLHLKKEYDFLRNKFSLNPMEHHIWKFLRLRPANFPTIRLAQFAMLIHKHPDFVTSLIHNESKEFPEAQMKTGVSEYWRTHYTFGKVSESKEKSLGSEALDNIKINTIAPWLFFYGKIHSRQTYIDKAIELFENTPAEKNSIIRYWKKNNIEPLHAGQSQALLQLNNEYCKPRGCLFCHIGNLVMTSKI